jgi:hypothetical protein
MYRNIITQEETIPNTIGQTTNINWDNSKEELKAMGWRIMPTEPELAEGYVRQSLKAIDSDGENGQWEVVDALIADLEREEQEYIQLTKSYALKLVENKFLLMCDQLTNNFMHLKLDFGELNAIINNMTDETMKVMTSV